MPFYLWELFEPGHLARALMDGYVRKQKHPTEPYTILNYTEKAVFDKQWDAVTLNCRGLIIDDDFKVIARPFKKFFNYSEHDNDVLGNLPKLDPNAEVLVSDKLDGSLGILYQLSDGSYAIATRGSFTSPQALHATEVWRERYSHLDPVVPTDVTLLFEIIYPENRIVCDYRGRDDLYLLGGVELERGRAFGPVDAGIWNRFPDRTIHYPGPKAQVFGYSTLADALAAEPRPGAEGLVVTFVNEGIMVKIKQEDYIILHKLVTGLSKRTVWEALGSGQSVEDVCLPLPDEFHGWVREVAAELVDKRDFELMQMRANFSTIIEELLFVDASGREYRKAFADLAKAYGPKAWGLFLLLDGKDPSAKIWQTLKPEGLETPFNGEESINE